MRDVERFWMALGLQDPWFVERTEFDAEARRLDLYLDFRRGGRFRCAECGADGCAAHDTTQKTWRHLDFFQHEAYLHARVPRADCEACGVKLVEVQYRRGRLGGIEDLPFDAGIVRKLRRAIEYRRGRLGAIRPGS